MTYSEKIKEIRTSKNMSLREFGELVGCHFSYLSTLERGFDTHTGKTPEPTVILLQRICAKTDYDFRLFLEETGYLKPQFNLTAEQHEFLKKIAAAVFYPVSDELSNPMISHFCEYKIIERVPDADVSNYKDGFSYYQITEYGKAILSESAASILPPVAAEPSEIQIIFDQLSPAHQGLILGEARTLLEADQKEETSSTAETRQRKQVTRE